MHTHGCLWEGRNFLDIWSCRPRGDIWFPRTVYHGRRNLLKTSSWTLGGSHRIQTVVANRSTVRGCHLQREEHTDKIPTVQVIINNLSYLHYIFFWLQLKQSRPFAIKWSCLSLIMQVSILRLSCLYITKQIYHLYLHTKLWNRFVCDQIEDPLIQQS